jgi:hypothetical protein
MKYKDKIMMNCEGAAGLVEKSRDKKLDLLERMGLWVHMAYCKFCTIFYKQSAILDQSARAYASRIDDGKKSYPLNPRRKDEIKRSLETELQKESK